MDLRDRAAREADAANADLESFSYSAAHDLRGPLRRIAGFVDILQEDYGGHFENGGQEILQAMRGQSARASQLIEDLLRLARIGRAPLAPVDLDVSALAKEIAGELGSKDPGRDVEWAIEPGLHARADGGLARVVFENLLGNAWKFTSKRSGARIEVGSADGGFFVRDNGAGFDPSLGERLFQPFQRLHSEAEFSGSGIGLATVARIVRRHGGDIAAAGQEGKGATFTFRFERTPAPVPCN
jgi:signal transduction histidine kinase